jgi:hypothetical protein
MNNDKPGPKMPGSFPGKRGRAKRPIEELRKAVEAIDKIRAADKTNAELAARKYGISSFTYYEYRRRVEAADRAAGYKVEKPTPTRAEHAPAPSTPADPSEGPAIDLLALPGGPRDPKRKPAAPVKREIRDATPADGPFVRVLVFEGSADEVTNAIKSMFYPEG